MLANAGLSSDRVVQIKRDSNNEYTFENANVVFGEKVCYMDGDALVATIEIDDKKANIAIQTESQVNLFLDIKSSSCHIKSRGNICIDANLAVRELNISAHSLHISRGTRFFPESGSINLDNDRGSLVIEEGAFIEAKNFSIKSHKMINDGGLILSDHSNVNIDNAMVNAGQFCVRKSKYFGKLFTAKGGKIEINEGATIGLDKNLDISELTNFSCNMSNVSVKENIKILSEEVDLKSSEFSAKRIVVDSSGLIDRCNMSAESKLSISGESLMIDYLNGKCKSLYVKGSTLSDNFSVKDAEFNHHQKVVFNHCSFDVKSSDIRGWVLFNNHSQLISNDPAGYHVVLGNVQFINSPYVVKSAIRNLQGSKLTVRHTGKKSVIVEEDKLIALVDFESSSSLLNNGKLKIRNAVTHFNAVHQDAGISSVKEGSILDVTDNLSGEGEKYKIDDKSRITGNNWYLHGDILKDGNLSAGCYILLRGNLYTSPTAKITGAIGRIDAYDIVARGKAALISTTIAIKNQLTLLSRLNLDRSFVDSKGISAGFDSELTAINTYIKSNKYLTSGVEDLTTSHIVGKEVEGEQSIFESYGDSSTTLKGRSSIAMKKYASAGVTYAKKGTLEDGIPSIISDEHFSASNADYFGDSLILRSKQAHFAGVVDLLDTLRLDGDSFFLSGQLIAKKNIVATLDKTYTNFMGGVYSNNIAITALLMTSVLGVHSAKQAYNVNALAHINLGLELANRLNINALASFKGVALPNFSGDLNDLLSKDNILDAGQKLLGYFFPGSKTIINLPFLAHNVYQVTSQLINHGQRLADCSYNPIRAHEIVSMLAGVKSAAQLGVSIGQSVYDALPISNPSQTSFQAVKQVKGESLKSFIKKIILDLSGNYTNSSLLGVGGFTAHMNVSDTSLLNLNTCASLATNSIRTTALANLNLGAQVASDMDLQVLQNNVAGYQRGINNYRQEKIFGVKPINKIAKGGHVGMHNPEVNTHSIDIGGSLSVSGIGNVDCEGDVTGEGELYFQDHVKFTVRGNNLFTGTAIGDTTPDEELYKKIEVPNLVDVESDCDSQDDSADIEDMLVIDEVLAVKQKKIERVNKIRERKAIENSIDNKRDQIKKSENDLEKYKNKIEKGEKYGAKLKDKTNKVIKLKEDLKILDEKL